MLRVGPITRKILLILVESPVRNLLWGDCRNMYLKLLHFTDLFLEKFHFLRIDGTAGEEDDVNLTVLILLVVNWQWWCWVVSQGRPLELIITIVAILMVMGILWLWCDNGGSAEAGYLLLLGGVLMIVVIVMMVGHHGGSCLISGF